MRPPPTTSRRRAGTRGGRATSSTPSARSRAWRSPSPADDVEAARGARAGGGRGPTCNRRRGATGGRWSGWGCGSRRRRRTAAPERVSRARRDRRRATRHDSAGARLPCADVSPSGARRRRDLEWSEAIDACREDGDPYLIAYALLRGAAGRSGGGRARTGRAPRSTRRCELAEPLGAAPLLEEAHALARRARARSSRATRRRHAPRRRVRAHRPRARGARPRRRRPLEPADRRGPVHQPEDRERPRLEHHRQAERLQPRRGRRARAPARARAV